MTEPLHPRAGLLLDITWLKNTTRRVAAAAEWQVIHRDLNREVTILLWEMHDNLEMLEGGLRKEVAGK